VVLKTENGTFVLRRMGGNPFMDSTLEGLVGQRLAFRGYVEDTLFIVESWAPLD
jgi:hypothetical protein